MDAANTLFEILQLSDQIPVAHALEPRSIRCPDALPVGAVTGCAGRIRILTILHIPFDRGRGRIIRQRLDVSDDVIDGCVVGQRRGHRRHYLTKNVFFVCTAGSVLEISQLALQIPVSLPGQFWRIQRGVAFRLRAMTGAAHRKERLARRSVSGSWSFGLCVRRIAA